MGCGAWCQKRKTIRVFVVPSEDSFEGGDRREEDDEDGDVVAGVADHRLGGESFGAHGGFFDGGAHEVDRLLRGEDVPEAVAREDAKLVAAGDGGCGHLGLGGDAVGLAVGVAERARHLEPRGADAERVEALDGSAGARDAEPLALVLGGVVAGEIEGASAAAQHRAAVPGVRHVQVRALHERGDGGGARGRCALPLLLLPRAVRPVRGSERGGERGARVEPALERRRDPDRERLAPELGALRAAVPVQHPAQVRAPAEHPRPQKVTVLHPVRAARAFGRERPHRHRRQVP
mmetsp:Transcript_27719/g.90681  ORF Transcript_27719/g.90681 Transcript_27719/m.90681 type:complete len:291 (-) Transcript_27719:310-1182(-)